MKKQPGCGYVRLPGVYIAPSIGGKESRPPGTEQKGIQKAANV